jgi:hypothetical protein
MYYADLTPYEYFMKTRGPITDNAPQPLNVGWLEAGHPFTKGDVSNVFMARLWAFCCAPVNLTRGFHECQFCSDESFAYLTVRQGDEKIGMGHAEIWVFGDDDKVYVAPTLIYHYITHHNYLPPEPFIRAVLEAPLPDTPEYDRLCSQFMWGKLLLREKAIERRHSQANQ